MRSIIVLSVFCLGLAGCGKQIKDFVGSGDSRAPASTAPTTSASSSTGLGVKISPGANIASGTQVKSQFAITPTGRTVKGSQVTSVFTMQANRPAP